MRLNWKLVLVCLEIVLIFMHDKCKFLPNLPLVRKLFWTHPIVLLDDVGLVESCFGPFQHGVSVGAK